MPVLMDTLADDGLDPSLASKNGFNGKINILITYEFDEGVAFISASTRKEQ